MTRLELLREIVVSIRLLYPHTRTRNPRARLIDLATRNREPAVINLAHDLVHVITVLNQCFRVRKGITIIESSREDNLNAMSLLVENINPEIIKYKGVRASYRCIKEKFGGIRFTQKELRNLNGYGKTGTSRHLNKLKEYEIIQISGGHKNRGYIYSLK